MAKIGEIYLGGKDGHPTTHEVYPSGVAFFLTKSSPFNEITQTDDGKWELEVKKNHQIIVARSNEIQLVEQILSEAYSHCQRFLDLLAVFHHKALMIKNPGTNFIALFNQDGQFVLRESSNADLFIETSATLTVVDKNGKVRENPPEPRHEWIPAFRYYRLSQSSSDLYEAYRNLFLSFESLLYGICPVIPREGETRWFTRAMTEVMKNVPLQDYAPPNTPDPVRHLVVTQYNDVRCKMFHSKDRGYLLPAEDLDPKIVSDAYQTLIRLWHEIVVHYYRRSIGEGGVTYPGFKLWMDNAAALGFSIYITIDPIQEEPNAASLLSVLIMPTHKNPTPSHLKIFLSSLKQPKYLANEVMYSGDYQPGMVLFKGTFNRECLSKLDIVHGIGTIINNNLIKVSNIEDGIRPEGIDKFESDVTLRLINKSSPKTIFS